jgi:non-specific serine/threonine protein kinase/serine/threonine-protein kinase
MGTVYAAHDERLDRPVAIKLLRRDLAEDPTVRRRFEREARSAASITHPHAVAVYDTGDDAKHDTFIVMELLSGRTLADELADGPLDEARLRDVAHDVLAALGAAHAEGIVHRDVKPGNILLADDGTVKVGDFGIATTLDTGDTSASIPLGTPAYAAPERLRGMPATERSDLYSLGVVLYEAASGTRPFAGDGPGAIAEAVVAGTHVPVRERCPELSAPVADAIERALARDPADRFATAEAMGAALTRAVEPVTEPLAAPATVALPMPARTPRRRPRRAWVWVTVAVVLLVVAAVVVVLVARSDDTSTTAPPSSAPAPSTAAPAGGGTESPPIPRPMARALERLDRATTP